MCNCTTFAAPLQEDLAELYRGHDAFLFTSRYEAWGMPVMEAMASGLAVVASRCLGVATFAQHAQNCLLADPQVRRGHGSTREEMLLRFGLIWFARSHCIIRLLAVQRW